MTAWKFSVWKINKTISCCNKFPSYLQTFPFIKVSLYRLHDVLSSRQTVWLIFTLPNNKIVFVFSRSRLMANKTKAIYNNFISQWNVKQTQLHSFEEKIYVLFKASTLLKARRLLFWWRQDDSWFVFLLSRIWKRERKEKEFR